MYGVFYSLKQINEDNFIVSIYWFFRFVLLILLCAIVAYVMEQFFENLVSTWTIYSHVSSYILMIQGYLLVGSLVIAAFFAIKYSKDQVPFWVITASYMV